ncbi:MAG: isovaleryl-CoA dehydrogenase [Gammaproteobacteria bacterium]|nr:isovaleryl-CoA dehydrogenase [Gammaproteobacteria bacterium]
MSFLNDAQDETIQLLRNTVREFVEREIAPRAESIDRDNQFPNELWPKFGELGLLGITVAEEYGGTNLGYLAHAIVMEEISRGCAAVALSYGAHSNLCTNQIHLHGTSAQKKQYLPLLCSGKFIGALAMSEPNAGSDVMSMRLTATQEKDSFVLNGTKMWITNGPCADVIVVYARTMLPDNSSGISAFIVESKWEGFKTAQKLDKLGMRGSNTCELVFENCKVPSENVLGQINGGAKVLMQGLNYERLILAAGPVGIMQACMDAVLPYVHVRKQFGKSIGEFELIQAKLADMYTGLMTSRAYLYALGEAADQGQLDRKGAASLILYTAEQATKAAGEAIQCLGGNGYINEYPVGRYWRDAKLYEIGAGTSEIRRMLIGRELYKEHQ